MIHVSLNIAMKYLNDAMMINFNFITLSDLLADLANIYNS